MILFSQRDKRWKDRRLGYHDTLTLGGAGCVVTCLAMIANRYGEDTNPDKINEDLKRINGFEGGLYRWKALTKLYPDISYHRFVDTPNPVSPEQFNEINQHLAGGHLVMIEVDMIPSTAKVDMHYVLITRKVRNGYEIADPWTGKLENLSKYGIAKFTIQRYILYTGEDMNRRDAITAVYKGILGHEPSKADLDRWDSSGKGIDECAKELLASLEYPKKIEGLKNEIKSNEETLKERDEIITEHLKKIDNLEEKEEILTAEIISNEKECDETISDITSEKVIVEGKLVEAKSKNKEWYQKYEKLLKDIVNQEEAIAEGIKDACNISIDYQQEWKKASGWDWILEGLKRLMGGDKK